MPSEPDVEVTEVAPGVQRFTVPLAIPSPDHLNLHVVRTPDGPLLVDTGLAGSERFLRLGLAKARATDPRVLVTHGHVDHWGLASAVTDRVLAHPASAEGMRYALGERNGTYPEWINAAAVDAAFGGVTALVTGMPAIEPIHDNQRLGAWTVLWTPGHDPGHVCLFRESDGVLICGDLLLPDFTPNVQPNWRGGDALGQFKHSLRRVADLGVTLVLPAHGEPYTDARGRVAELLAHHDRRLTVLRGGLADGPQDLATMRELAFGARATESAADAMLAEFETYAHLDHLRRSGEVEQGDGGLWRLVRERAA